MKKLGFKKKLMDFLFVFTFLLFSASVAEPQGPSLDLPPGAQVPNRYIVVLHDGISPQSVARSHAITPTEVYTAALNGFAGPVSPGQAQALARDPRVKHVEPDRIVAIVPPVGPPIVRVQLHGNNFETLTTGIDRIDAELNIRTDVSAIGIAIIDTGIWKTHVDLNVAGGVNYTTADRNKWSDDNGHGTHVAGIAAAKTGDNRGVRGVAPNARLFAVKVFDKNGRSFWSWIIAGVDWVTNNASAKGIRVANMSFGGEGTSSALNDAIQKMVAAGVTAVVAAGNSRKDAATFSPANHPDVITVSAMADSNGICGSGGPATSYGVDDTFATFSNYGSVVKIAAPGVDITSTWKGDKFNPGGLYYTASGTSMSSPHVAGAAAQYIASQLALGNTPAPTVVRSALINAGTPQGQLCGVDATGRQRGGFTGDPDGIPEPLEDAAGL